MTSSTTTSTTKRKTTSSRSPRGEGAPGRGAVLTPDGSSGPGPATGAGPCRFALGLGSNRGPSEALLRRALARLAAALGPLDIAPLYRTAPRSAAGASLPQRPYLNTAAAGVTELPPDGVLSLAKRVESLAGRGPAERDAPRPLDIDLLLYLAPSGAPVVRTDPELTLPHPRLTQRRFVLAPLAAVAPGWRVPPSGETVAELLARVGQEAEVEEIGWSEASAGGA